MIRTQLERDILRLDFPSFIRRSFQELNPGQPFHDGFHIDLIAAKLEACRRGDIKRLIINIPPRNLKSIAASVAFPAWLLGHNPTERVICVSYADGLAENLAIQSRNVMVSPWYQDLFPNTRFPRATMAAHELTTTERGYRMATSVGGVLTGRGASFIVIDDPQKPDEAISDTRRHSVNEWFDHTLMSRLDDKATGCIIIIMQRLHLDDLSAHAMQQGGWEVISLPAIAKHDESHFVDLPLGPYTYTRKEGEALHPNRESLDVLQKVREQLGEYAFAGQYLQDPVPEGGAVVKRDWFRYYKQNEMPQYWDHIIQSWDCAAKPGDLNSYSVCTTWASVKGQIYLLHVLRERMTWMQLKDAAVALYHQYKPNQILVEEKSAGIQLLNELPAMNIYKAQAVTPKLDKKVRLYAQSGVIQSGAVHLPEGPAWVEPFVAELTNFPYASYDDQVDSTTQALAWFSDATKEPGFLGYLRIMNDPELRRQKGWDR